MEKHRNIETITVSKFKATCLNLLQRIKNTNQPLLITKKGHPLVIVQAYESQKVKKSYFGIMKQNTKINGDIISPLSEEDWEVLT